MSPLDLVIRNAPSPPPATLPRRHRHRATAASSRSRKGLPPARARDRRGRPRGHARRRRRATATSTSRCRRRLAHGRRLRHRHALGGLRRHHHRDPVRGAAKGQSLREAVDDYHRRAEGSAHVDYAFHLIVSDPTPAVLQRGTAGADRRGLHVVQDLHDLRRPEARRRPDPRRARGRARARRDGDDPRGERRLHRVADRARLEAAGRTAPRFHAHARPMLVEREATHRAIALAELVDVPILIVHVSGREAVEQIRWARAQRPADLRRDLPAVPVPDRRRSRHRRQLPRRQVRLQPAAARQANQQVIWNGARRRPVHGVLVRPRAVPLRRTAGKKPGGEEVAFRHIPNGIPGIETRLPLLYSEGVLARAHHARPLRRAHRHESGQGLRPASAQGHDRDRLRCRPRDLGRTSERDACATRCCTTPSTTRRTKA